MSLTEAEANTLCRTTDAGSGWYDALEGLRQRFDVEDVSSDWERIQDAVCNDEEPVIVRLGLVISSLATGPTEVAFAGHAVVVHEIGERGVTFMDPLTGTNVTESEAQFLASWDRGAELACVVRCP